MDEMGLSDNQRSMAVKLSDKLRKLFHAYQRQQEGHVKRNSTDGAAQSAISDVRLNDQISGLESDCADLFKRLSDSLLGQTSVKQSSLGAAYSVDEESDEYFDRTKKRKKLSSDDSTLPITKQSISDQLSKLYILRDECESKLHSISDATSSPGSSSDDPFEAFMASTEKEVNESTASAERIKLKKIQEDIARLEESQAMMDMYAFTDPSYKKPVHVSKPHVSSPKNTIKGQWTVWESEFAKDESIPVRLVSGSKQHAQPSPPSSSVVLNAQQGGLQFMSRSQAELHQSSSITQFETNQSKMDALKKKLGY